MNNKLPLVTIITVTYNAGQLLEETIKSILSQDYENIEYIIIDGSSTDNTVNIIKQYEQKITYWCSEPDNGIYEAMNKGIDQTSGYWINFMNAGDTFYNNTTVSNVIKNLKTDTDLISGDIIYVHENKKSYIKQETINYPFQQMFCFHQTLFTKSSIMKKYKFSTEFKISGDYDFVLKCYVNNHKFQFLELPLANFLSGGAAETNNIRARIEDMFIQSKHLENMSDIYNSHSYARLKSCENSNNSLLTKLVNNLYHQYKTLGLNQKKFILYGYGHIGKMIEANFKKNIISIVDQNYKNIERNSIQPLSSISSQNFDYILISVLGKEKEIEESLIREYNIPKTKILTFSI